MVAGVDDSPRFAEGTGIYLVMRKEGSKRYVSDNDRVQLLVVGEWPQEGTTRRLCVL